MFITATYNGNPDLSTGALVKTFVQDVSEAPVITTLDGNASVALKHPENVIYVATIQAKNDEEQTLEEILTYSLRGEHASLFDINSTTGEITFNQPPDYEDSQYIGREDEQIYNIIARATDSGFPALYDEQEISVQIVEGSELPFADPVISLSQDTQEEVPLDIPLINFLVRDDFGNSPRGIASAEISKNGISGFANISYDASIDLPGEFLLGKFFLSTR